MKYVRVVIWSLFCLLWLTPVVAAAFGADCPEVVRAALDATQELCEATGRNQACYGHVLLEAQPQPGVSQFAFSEEGDVVDLTAVQSLRLSPMQVESGLWGVALMRLQANLSAAQNGDVTLLTFGGVEIQNTVPTPTQLNVTVIVDEYINVRRGPSTEAGEVAVLAPGDTVVAVERLADNSWLRVELPNSGETGWLSTPLVASDGDLDTLNIAAPWSPHYRPMQAFYFQSEADAPNCSEAPTSGLLIQTPEGAGEVNLLINEVNIQIGSTVFFQAGENLTITTLEGHADVTWNGVTHTAIAGTQVVVPLDADMLPAGPPSLPAPYQSENALEMLPIDLLDRDITITPSLTQDEIDEYLQHVVVDSATSLESDGDTVITTAGSETVVSGDTNSGNGSSGQGETVSSGSTGGEAGGGEAGGGESGGGETGGGGDDDDGGGLLCLPLLPLFCH